MVVLYFTRHHFDIHTPGGQISLGLIFGGILGNLTDRLIRKHVLDFLFFYVIRATAAKWVSPPSTLRIP